MVEEKQAQQRVTFDDVFNALGEEQHAFDTNAARIRDAIGYGSNATIQKHLDKIRDDINKKRLQDVDSAASETPKLPKDLFKDSLESLWSEAWKTAQVATLSRIERLTIEVDGLKQKSDAQVNDITELSIEVDDLKDIIDSNEKSLEQLNSDHEANLSTVKLEVEDLQFKLEKSQEAVAKANSEVVQIKKEAEQEKQVMLRDAEISKITMQSTIDHLNEKISDLKVFRIVKDSQIVPELNK